MTDGLGAEQPEADVLDQRRTQAPADEQFEPFDELPAEADEADAVEQHLVVPEPDDREI